MTNKKPAGAGKSSFDLIEAEKLFPYLTPIDSLMLLDLGSGTGNYALAAAKRAGSAAKIYAYDLWEDGILELRLQAEAAGFTNLKAQVADITDPLPLPADCVDVCLMATVFHDLVEAGNYEGTLAEAARVLKPHGGLLLVEFKKVEPPPGPPMNIRLSPSELDLLVIPFGFVLTHREDLGPSTYLSRYGLDNRSIG